MKVRAVYLGLFYALVMSVLVLSLLPIDHPDVSSNDKVNHLIAYAALMVFGFLAHRRMLLVALGVMVFGIVVELLQGQTSYRMLSMADVLANTAGVLLGCVSIFVFKVIKTKSSKQDL